MKVLYIEDIVTEDNLYDSIFLIGPALPAWYQQALLLLRNLKYEGSVLIPLSKEASHAENTSLEWTKTYLGEALGILFWVPKFSDVDTNDAIHFGMWVGYDGMFYGRPEDAESPDVDCLDRFYEKETSATPSSSLKDLIGDLLDWMGEIDGETVV